MNRHANDIRKAVKDCSERGLYAASKWAGDFLLNIPPHERPAPAHLPPSASLGFRTSTPNRTMSSRQSLSFAEDSNMITEDDVHVNEDLWALEEDLYVAAREAFSCKELERTAHILSACRSPKAKFLCLYSRYLASEKEALDNWTYRKGPRSHDDRPINDQLTALLAALEDVNAPNPSNSQYAKDPFLLYLKGIILGSLKRRPEATECLILSVNAYPWNWSAWVQLGAMIEDPAEWTSLQPHLPDHPVTKMLQCRILLESNAPPESLEDVVNDLSELFPHSLFIMSQRALLNYHHRDFDEAEALFDHIYQTDPFRIDYIDIYANVLYVQQARSKLSDLAQKFIKTDKDRPEVCCLVGNYYSLRNEHEKAVKYFRRAIQLDPSHLAAWTLMGHEYVELKNPHAANEAYRRALDVNRKDFRAWFGLGKTYELLNMTQYAIHYYQRAAALRPYDPTMWLALAGCYRSLSRWKEAIDCMNRSQSCGEALDPVHFVFIATLHEKMGDYASATAWYQRCVEVSRKQGKHLSEYARSSVAIARYHIESYSQGKRGLNGEAGDLVEAEKHLEPIASSNVEDAATAQELMRKLKQLKTGS